MLQVYAADGTTLLSTNQVGYQSPFSSLALHLAPGVYFAQVTGVDGVNGRYTIQANQTGFTGGPSLGKPTDTDNEPNDTAATATPLTLGVESDNTLASPSGDVDWFVFTLP